MKRIIILILLFIIIITNILFINNNKGKNKLEKIKVAEVAHSVFYAPQYVALKKGYFKDEGLDVQFILTPGADKVASSLISKDADIGLCGSEQSIYVYNSGKKDYMINFATLTRRDGSFIFSRKNEKNFKLENLKGKKIIGGRKGGMPEMTLEYILKDNNINLKDVNIDTSVEFASMASSFISGNGDYVTLFEPSATKLENEGKGYIVGYLGEYTSSVPYTSYNALKSYINKNKDTIKKFNKAINRGLEYVLNNNSKDIAKEITIYFPEINKDELSVMIKRYKDNKAWIKSTYLSKKEFNHMQDIIINSKIIDKKVPYNKLVKNYE